MIERPPSEYRSYRALLWWTTLTLVTAWLPMMRGVMDGASYEWGTTFFGSRLSGRGTAGDFWYPLLRSAIGLALLWVAWRRPTRAIRGLVAAYTALVAADITWAAAASPNGFRFRGDTLGVDISLTWVAPVCAAIFTAIALYWALSGRGSGTEGDARVWSSGARRRLIVAAAMLPLQFMLLRSAQGMDWRDMLGVVLTIAQLWLLSAAFASRPRARAA